MYKRWRVYSTFLTGLLIGLAYAVILSGWQPSDSNTDPVAGLFEWNALILAFSGILGGVIYSVMVNGYVEMPRFVAHRGDKFKAGIFGDILLGLSGAFILHSLLPTDVAASDQGRLSNTALAATGIIGGYGGRAILKFALNRFFKDSQAFSAELPPITQSALPEIQEDLLQETASSAQSLIERVDHYIEWGASTSDLAALQQAVHRVPPAVREQVFIALIDLHKAASQIKLTSEQLHRLIPIYEALIAGEPNNDAYWGQLALIHRDGTPPNFAQALTSLDTAIARRGPLTMGKPWQYELNRAAIRIQQTYATTQTFDFAAPEQDRILTDLLAIAAVYNLETILQAAQTDQIPQTVLDWLRHHQTWLTSRSDTRLLASALGQALSFEAEEEDTSHPVQLSEPTFDDPPHPVANEDQVDDSAVVEEPVLLEPQLEVKSGAIAPAEPPTIELQPFPEPANPDGKTLPEIYSTLGSCYDILTLDPFDISHSAKQHQVFHFYPGEAVAIEDEGSKVLRPKGTKYITGSRGSSSSSEQTSILYTEADVQRLYASAMGGIATHLMGLFLPFSLSPSYGTFRQERRYEKSIYAFTRAEYVHFTLALDPDFWTDLHLKPQFQQAVTHLPEDYDELAYGHFINEFGTHVSIQTTFGGMVRQSIRLNESTYAAVAQQGVKLEAEAKKIFKAQYSKESESSTYQEIRDNSEELIFCGGIAKENIYDWFATVKSDPAPIKLELLPLHELFTPQYFPHDKSIVQKQKLLVEATQAYLESKTEKLAWEPWPSIAAGGSGGSEFSDLELSPNRLESNQNRYQNARVTEVRVWIGACIDAVQMVLESEALPLSAHGGQGGELKTLHLDPDDYITGVEVTTGSLQTLIVTGGPYITSLKISTRKAGPWIVGNHNHPKAISLDVPTDYQVIGFHGRCGKYLDSLGVISIPLPDNTQKYLPQE